MLSPTSNSAASAARKSTGFSAAFAPPTKKVVEKTPAEESKFPAKPIDPVKQSEAVNRLAQPRDPADKI